MIVTSTFTAINIFGPQGCKYSQGQKGTICYSFLFTNFHMKRLGMTLHPTPGLFGGRPHPEDTYTLSQRRLRTVRPGEKKGNLQRWSILRWLPGAFSSEILRKIWRNMFETTPLRTAVSNKKQQIEASQRFFLWFLCKLASWRKL